MTNKLADETSAYLRQHAGNPVDWFPWGPEPWEKARREDRPVLVSIGYSSCHWCHVMERESFEDPAVAEQMNAELVCIKVDREERPDVDQIYMEAILRLLGHGGWPLNVFCTADGRPFFGGTYFPPAGAHGRASWRDVVGAVARLHREERSRVDAQADQIVAALHERPDLPAAPAPGLDALTTLSRELMQRADRAHGGFGAAPKFPTPTQLEALLLATAGHRAVTGTLEHVALTCRRMARGGLFDQLGGGFHRYSTDDRWLVPHFEKMLYDQGQLLRVYAETWRQTGDPALVWPIEETIDYLEREMRSPDGGFFASQDADSEGEEGRFYVFDREEIARVLGEERGAGFADAYGVTRTGTFERTGKSVLEHALAGERPRFASERAALLEARTRRVPPETDRKQVTAWLAYAISGLATAAGVLDRRDWLDAANRTTRFVLERLWTPDGLRRIWDSGTARVPGFLDDHAALLCALLDLHRAGGDEALVGRALALCDVIVDRFWDAGRAEFFLGPAGDATLPFRAASDADGATPASAGLAVLGLVRAAALTGREDLDSVAAAAIEAQAPLVARIPTMAPTLLRAAATRDLGGGLALVLGPTDDPATHALAARARHLLGPDDAVVVAEPGTLPRWLDPAWSEGRVVVDGTPTAWLCRGTACSLPATRPDALELPPTAATRSPA